MTITILSLILFLIFIVLGGFHFYWLFGGIWGLKKVIPSQNNKVSPLTIPKFATLLVGLVLVLFGLMYLIKLDVISVQASYWATNYGFWIIPSVFIIRAIGDFNYVGFFKKVKHTEFAQSDSKIFSPLCLIIGVLGIVIQLIDK